MKKGKIGRILKFFLKRPFNVNVCIFMGLPFFFLDTNVYQELAILGVSYLLFPSAIFRKRR